MSFIHVIGGRPEDYAPPKERDVPPRALTAEEASWIREAISYLYDVGWRPYGEAAYGWRAAVGWALAQVDAVFAGEDPTIDGRHDV